MLGDKLCKLYSREEATEILLTAADSESVGLRTGLRFSNQLPGDVATAGLWPSLGLDIER